MLGVDSRLTPNEATICDLRTSSSLVNLVISAPECITTSTQGFQCLGSSKGLVRAWSNSNHAFLRPFLRLRVGGDAHAPKRTEFRKKFPMAGEVLTWVHLGLYS